MTRSLRTLLLAAVGLGVSGCGILDDQEPRRERANVVIQGTSPVPLSLITSSEFVIETDPETFEQTAVLLVSDTVEITPPFDDTYRIDAFERFLVRLVNADSAVASIRMQVLVDGSLEYDQAADMSQGASLEFSFTVRRFF